MTNKDLIVSYAEKVLYDKLITSSFSIQVDESTDLTHKYDVVAFVRFTMCHSWAVFSPQHPEKKMCHLRPPLPLRVHVPLMNSNSQWQRGSQMANYHLLMTTETSLFSRHFFIT